MTGHLKNSQMLANLDLVVKHLSAAQRGELLKVVCQFPDLFVDTPACTKVLEHDNEVGEARPIKQHFYRVSAEKRQMMEAEITYMLEHCIAELSSSAWALPCVLIPKSDNTPRFCTDYRKVNSVTKTRFISIAPDCVD